LKSGLFGKCLIDNRLLLISQGNNMDPMFDDDRSEYEYDELPEYVAAHFQHGMDADAMYLSNVKQYIRSGVDVNKKYDYSQETILH